jgi:tRNA (guanosine-2'-O-)-methyltransferase
MHGCAPLPASPRTASKESYATRVFGEPANTPRTACVTTGPELCFNALDDNCNGLLEEGCGLGSGPIHVVVAWTDPSADLDLALDTPGGERVFDGNRLSSKGFHFERDCPGEGCAGQNAEAIYFVSARPPPEEAPSGRPKSATAAPMHSDARPPSGEYVVEVRLSESRGAALPVRARVGLRVFGRVYAKELELSELAEKRSLPFTLN